MKELEMKSFNIGQILGLVTSDNHDVKNDVTWKRKNSISIYPYVTQLFLPYIVFSVVSSADLKHCDEYFRHI